MLDYLRRHYASIDPRTLGLWRIAIALLLLVDLAKRSQIISVFYTNDGLLPNHRVLWHPAREHMLSFLFSFIEAAQVRVVFVGIALVYLCLLVGYRTRLMQVLSWLCLISLQVRIDMLSNGGDFVFGLLMLWSAFLPLGRRFSIDALLAEQHSRDDTEQVVSLAVVVATLQLCVIYAFNVIHKTGVTWRDGSAVYWLLHQERIVTTLGLWAREHVPFGVLRAMSYATLAVEAALPLLILSPWGRPWTRRLAIVCIFGLHTGIALLSNLGLFSPVMMAFSLMLLDGRDWEALERRLGLRVQLSLWAERIRPFVKVLRPAATHPPLTAAGAMVSQIAIALLALAATLQVLLENRVVPRALREHTPGMLRATVEYFRLNQGWKMFAPNAPTTDRWIVVDAVTRDGRRVDPFNGVASRIADPSRRDIPERLEQAYWFCDYSARIPDKERFHESLRDWILSYGERTQRPEDHIVGFAAWVIEQDSPKPGEPGPSSVGSRVFLTYVRAPDEP